MKFSQQEIIALRNALILYRIDRPWNEEYKMFLKELEGRFLSKIDPKL